MDAGTAVWSALIAASGALLLKLLDVLVSARRGRATAHLSQAEFFQANLLKRVQDLESRNEELTEQMVAASQERGAQAAELRDLRTDAAAERQRLTILIGKLQLQIKANAAHLRELHAALALEDEPIRLRIESRITTRYLPPDPEGTGDG